MLHRVEVCLRPEHEDAMGRKLVKQIKNALGIQLEDIRVIRVYTLYGLEQVELEKILELAVLHDPVLQQAQLEPYSLSADWVLEVGFRPGVTDTVARTAKETLELVFPEKKGKLRAYTAVQYHLRGKVSAADAQKIASDFVANELIEWFELKSGTDWTETPGFIPRESRVLGEESDLVAVIPFSQMTDEELLNYSRENTLALSLEELRVIRDYYARPEVASARKNTGLPADPTDGEVEVLAQTWSEHCKHKIFSAAINYENTETGHKKRINSLYKTYIQGSTKVLRQNMGERDFCRSVFKDNAGVVQFVKGYHLCIKVETHNSPSALDPYGGSLTGIVGVNRDPMGTGMGAELLCNMDVSCFASPFHQAELPPRLLHPRRIMEGVRAGVEHGGNKSGFPVVNGSLVFDERFLGKPLVFCGTVGLIPETVAGKPGYEKKAEVGDIIVMAGGRVGKDGIHGATFSSEELHEGSPATTVQLGDPNLQRRMYDFIMLARDRGLYSAITDNGAGGLSSSVGEMAQDTGGCLMDLSRVPLKYKGLPPWEILLSEAQERMTLAVPKKSLNEFMSLAASMGVEATALGEFTASGYFHTTYGDKTVTWLSMDFLHDGLPQMQLEARWVAPVYDRTARIMEQEQGKGAGELLKTMLGRLNICSKEALIRQFDHEVKGGSVVKPLVGVERDGPADAAVLRPVLDRPEAIVLAHGICPKYSDYDTYWMMANAIDEAVRNAVAVGADPDQMAGVDNFCWCDPVQSERTPDGHYKLAQLVRANEALSDYCLAYGVPCVSGKDSMKNDYSGGGVKISIPPTVLFSVLGFMPEASQAMTSDFKQAGDVIYILGLTRRELAGSELAQELGKIGGLLPQVDALTARKRYQSLYLAISRGLVTACHDLSDGGLAVSLAEMCVGGRLGAEVDPWLAPYNGELNMTELLYSESASRFLVSVPQNQSVAFEQLFSGQHFARIGQVTSEATLILKQNGQVYLQEQVTELAKAFKNTLG